MSNRVTFLIALFVALGTFACTCIQSLADDQEYANSVCAANNSDCPSRSSSTSCPKDANEQYIPGNTYCSAGLNGESCAEETGFNCKTLAPDSCGNQMDCATGMLIVNGVETVPCTETVDTCASAPIPGS